MSPAKIRLARQKQNLTQAALAKRIGVRQSSVSQWERGRSAPELSTRIKLAETLHMVLEDVLPEAANTARSGALLFAIEENGQARLRVNVVGPAEAIVPIMRLLFEAGLVLRPQQEIIE